VVHLSVFEGLISIDNIKYHREHNNENRKEQQEHLEIKDNTNDHGDDVTELTYDPHEEESLYQQDQDYKNHY